MDGNKGNQGPSDYEMDCPHGLPAAKEINPAR
jgi:hypothetical protein